MVAGKRGEAEILGSDGVLGGIVSGYLVGGGGSGMGGVVFNMQGSVTVVNSTLEGNVAAGGQAQGTATAGEGLGGAIFNLNGTVSLTDVTVDANTAAQGGGGVYDLVYDSITARTAAVKLKDSILYGSAGGVSDLVSNKPMQTNAGSNLGTATVDATAANIVGASQALGGGTISGTPLTADPQLGALADNGGPTDTQALPASSPAVNAGDCPTSVDQRGQPRPDNGESVCDLGAYELQDLPTRLTGTPAIVQLSGLKLYLFALGATLTGPGGTPLSGQTITFTAGATKLCTATTGTDGTASCNASASVLWIVLSGGYRASFAGAGDYSPSSATAPLIS
jgi:hypothetical protein